MKLILNIMLLAILFAYSFCVANTTQVTALQYYFDTDPGVGIAGNGAIIPINPTDSLNQNFSFPVAGLSAGMHNLYVRVKDENGSWSIAERRMFFIDNVGSSDVSAYQYYFDNDPGVGIPGNGAIVDITDTSDFDQTIQIPLSVTFVNGIHNLYIRTKNASGRWSIAERRMFIVGNTPTQDITAIEYFFDTDPGVNNATPISVATNDTINQNFAVFVPGGTTGGIHYLYVRAKDSKNHWSIFERDTFNTLTGVVPSVITAQGPTTFCVGDSVLLSTPPVSGINYHWLKNDTLIVGATFDSLYVNSSGTYTLQAINNTDTAISNAIVVTVNTHVTPSVALNAPITSVCVGGSLNFSASAVDPGTAPQYNFWVNGVSIQNSSSSNFTLSNIVIPDTVRCILHANNLCQSDSLAYSVNITIVPTVPAIPTISISANDTAICSTDSTVFTSIITDGGSNPYYQWNLNGAPILGANAPGVTFIPSALSNNDIISCTITSNASCVSSSPVTSNSVIITVNPTPTVSVNPVAAAVCAGSPSVTLTASGASSYSWSPATGLSSTTTAQVTASPVANTNYTIVGVSNGCTDTAYATVSFTSSGTASLAISTATNSVCAGNNVIFTATPSYGGTSPTYQWKKNGVNIVGAVAFLFSSSTLQNNDVISCDMVSNDPCVTTTAASSNSITMSVSATSTPNVSILSSGNNICAGSNVTFTATPSFGGSSPTYVWKVNGNIVSTSGATYSSNSLSDNDTVRCVMTSNAVCAIPATVASNTVLMSVSPLVTPTITISASQTSICSGTAVSFTSVITGGGSSPSYQWQKNNVDIAGATSASYSSSSLSNFDAISCVLGSSNACPSPTSISSNSISISVAQSGVASIQVASSSGNIICAGNTPVFIATILNGGSSPAYQWYYNGVIQAGQTTNTFFPTATINTNDSVRCVLTSNANCIPNTVVSSALVVMTVLPNVTASVSIASDASTICRGARVIFTATPGAGITNPLYQWRINGINIPQETNSVFSSTTLNQGDDVSALLFSAAQCLSSNNVASNNITMTVNATNFGLEFTTDTQSPSAGSQFTVHLTNTTPVTTNRVFTWYFGDGTNAQVVNAQAHPYFYNGDYSVALHAMDTTTGCADSISKANYIHCAGSISTCSQTVSLSPAAANIAGCEGGSVSMVCTTNASTPTYQWNKNGIPMGGETQSNYIATTPGNYSVTVYNAGGCPVTSSGKHLTFAAAAALAPVIAQTGIFQSCVLNSVTLSVTGTYSSYLWSTGETTQNISVSQSGLYTVMGTNTVGCNRQSNPIAVNNSTVAAPEICMVTVDTILNKNVLVWEKPITTDIDSFVVFRETNQQSVYEEIGRQDYSALSEFVDTASEPMAHADVYKLAIVDNCGNLTLPSAYHRTMHLQLSPNIGTSRMLSWNNDLGYIANEYIVSRGHLGAMHEIDTISGTLNTYTDYPPANIGNDTVYRIDVLYAQPCVSSAKSLLQARIRASSNGSTNKTILGVGVEELTMNNDFAVFPNPTKDRLTVVLHSKYNIQNSKLLLVDVLGKVVMDEPITAKQSTINMQHVANGVYFVKILSNNGNMVVKKVVKE